MSRRGVALADRRRSAARCSLSKSSANSASPRSGVSEPSLAHASRASAVRPKAGTMECPPPPAMTCVTASSSPSVDMADMISAAAPSPRATPHR
eukprot:2494453-Pleurochrysis_carterae.AAC.1